MYTIRVYPLSQSHFVSQIYAGLFDLASSGEIKLEFTLKPKVKICEREDWGSKANRRIVYLEIWDSKKLISKVCFDMLDGPEIISLNGIEYCDSYFKRSYSDAFWEECPDLWQKKHPEYVKKIHPYGFNYPCDSAHEFGNARNMLIHKIATKLIVTEPMESMREIIRELLGRRKRIEVPNISPDERAENLILFQTRLFDPKDHEPHSDEIDYNNKYRAAITKSLKREFGKRFIGGLMRNDYTLKYYPELITSEGISRENYLDIVRKCKVAVFSRGIRQSTGWRLPEYMSMSRCVVSQTLAYDTPVPLINGQHFLTFNSIEACVESCELLLTDDSLAHGLRNNIYQYFNNFNTPGMIVKNCINTAVEIGVSFLKDT